MFWHKVKYDYVTIMLQQQMTVEISEGLHKLLAWKVKNDIPCSEK